MLKGIGTDIMEINRLKTALLRRPQLQKRLFSERELNYCTAKPNPWPSFAVRFAAKEAVMKALGVGLGACKWREIEIINLPGGRPAVVLHGRARELAEDKQVQSWQISLSHSENDALAFVAAE